MAFGKQAFSLKARSLGYSHLSDPWQPGMYVDMNPSVCNGWVRTANPIGEKCQNVVNIVDAAIFKALYSSRFDDEGKIP